MFVIRVMPLGLVKRNKGLNDIIKGPLEDDGLQNLNAIYPQFRKMKDSDSTDVRQLTGHSRRVKILTEETLIPSSRLSRLKYTNP